MSRQSDKESGRAPVKSKNRASSRLLVAPFENLTGDPRLDYVGRIAADGLSIAVGQAGNVAILSHSGGLCVGLLTDTRRFGFSHIVSSGNEATVSAAVFLEYLLEDPHTAIVGGFIEAIREPERFAAALDRAAALGKPVVMVSRDGTIRGDLTCSTSQAKS